METVFAEYIWLDGTSPVKLIRSKARVLSFKSDKVKIEDFPEWSFDGSSTSQADGEDSDCILKPVNFVKDPFKDNGYLVLCEVFNPDNTEHASNTRFYLRKVLEEGAEKLDPWVGFEQEYTLFKRNIPLGWPEHGYPAPQGPYYCGVGSEQIFGRELAEEHAQVCLKAGLIYYGMNAEVMPGQWEFQLGYRGIEGDDPGILNVADQMWIARWLIHKISEKYDVHVSFDNKPVKGDWNGAGMHTNFSTNEMRDKSTGRKAIEDAISRLSKKHKEHIALYGHKLEERLTGLHETASIHEFSSGAADRGKSIRIPKPVELKGYGYIEDRRPGANADPYLVGASLTSTICDVSNPDVFEDTNIEKVA